MADVQEFIGQSIGDYHLLRLLGQGTFGAVYLAEHLHNHASVAMKLLHFPLTSRNNLRAFLNEARTVRLRHPHIVPILDFGLSRDDLPYLVMIYADKGSLRDRHPEGSKLSNETIDTYVQQLASALQYAHDHRIIHRDVKPENMLVRSDGTVQLSDFGIAKITEHTSLSTLHKDAGTPAYAAPEQSQGQACPASDQYALAIVVYEWLVGQRPFQGHHFAIMAQHRMNEPPSLHGICSGVSPQIEKVIFKALAKNPADRFPTITRFAEALHIALQEATIPTQQLSMEATTEDKPEPKASQQEGGVPASLPKTNSPPYSPALAKNRSEKMIQHQALALRPPTVALRRTHSRFRAVLLMPISIFLISLVIIAAFTVHLPSNRPVLPTPTPTITVTTNPTSTPHPTPPPVVIKPLIPAGKQLYGTQLYGTQQPSPACDNQGGRWKTNTSDAQVTCNADGIRIVNTSGHLAVVNLDQLVGNQSSWPSQNFIVQVTINLHSHGAFGIDFQLQTSNNSQGYYAYLLSPPRDWSFKHYDTQGNFKDNVHSDQLFSSLPKTKFTIDIRVEGTKYSFFMDGKYTGKADTISPLGKQITGLAVDANADITFSNLAIYAQP